MAGVSEYDSLESFINIMREGIKNATDSCSKLKTKAVGKFTSLDLRVLRCLTAYAVYIRRSFLQYPY